MQALIPASEQLTRPMRFIETDYGGYRLFIATTGYTGETGFEIYAPNALMEELWCKLMQQGAAHGMLPAGLAARNSLRLEMGYALYGHEIDGTIAATESVAAWSVKLAKGDFLGKAALLALEGSPSKRKSLGLQLLTPGVMRDGYLLFKEGQKIGLVTSGGYSPTLNRSIALSLVDRPLAVGDHLEVQMRSHRASATVSPLPFIAHVHNHESVN
jgi:aminomethyltransferase